MDVHGPGITNVFISPDMVQELLSGKYLIGLTKCWDWN